MAKQKTQSSAKGSSKVSGKGADQGLVQGDGGEAHYTAKTADQTLTTNQGIPVSDNQNSLRGGARGPTLLEDFVLREKITHFDHERIPERIVHARGTGAHGYFQVYKSQAKLTKAAFLQDPKVKTPVFVRFSTVAGGAGSVDLPRDVRGFAVKFYTQEGNFDLVGNNIPVFFIQDAIKFPDLIHSVKMEADRGFPQAASAHDTFWDFASLMPESMHMLTWAMSDRAIPRSYRMMEGFGIHTFRFINADGKVSFVKFHWRPLLGAQSVVWDEAVKINGADNDFHRRDLWEAIESGDYPEYEFGVQVFDEDFADEFDFDVLDSTKLIPEELVPVQIIGKMVLDRNVDNFFAETEQAAYHPANIVPGIDFSEDPLLQGRLFSYQDTQLIRLGGPNFHQIPINAPKCPMRNFQRDGFMQMNVPTGRANYEPNSIDPASPREDPKRGFVTVPIEPDGPKLRVRSETFADHYSQARMHYRSLSEPEQRHMASAFAFEFAKVETPAIRTRMLGHLMLIDPDLGATVEEALGMEGQADKITPARAPIDVDPSPTLSIVNKAPETLKGRKVGVLVSDGVPAALLTSLLTAIEKEGAKAAIIAPKIGGVRDDGGKTVMPQHALSGAPSVLFDAVVLALSEDGAAQLSTEAAALGFVNDAFGHLKIIGHTKGAMALLEAAGISDKADDGFVALAGARDTAAFIAAAKRHRVWDREPKLRSPG
ncbi:MAG: Catalase [Xanthobacteraceae bacterium]|nr:Catalase [Xanthobacteraceae bacterium]